MNCGKPHELPSDDGIGEEAFTRLGLKSQTAFAVIIRPCGAEKESVMPRFFISPEALSPDRASAVVTGDDARHISRSLRMRVGEAITLCDGRGTDFVGEIAAIGADSVTVAVSEAKPSSSEPPYRAVVYQALVRGERFDAAIQKSVEFGAAALVPVATERATVRLDQRDAEKKRVRWQRIATEAAMQCGRGVIPTVEPLVSFGEAIATAPGLRLFCYEEERTLHLRDALASAGEVGEISLFIGPEGGFAEAEAEAAKAAGALSVSLGRRILRTESAAPFALACLAYELDR